MTLEALPVKFLHTSYGRIAHRETGQGPAAVFLHGLPLSGRQWRDVMPALAHRRRCLALDQMGLGQTEPAAEAEADLSYAGQADMVAAFFDAAGIERVDLVGNDTGGGVCQLFLARHPQRVRSLVLTNCEVHDLWPNALLKGFYAGVADGSVTALLRAMLEDTALGQEHLGRLVYADPRTLTAETIAACVAPIVASPARVTLFERLCRWQPSHQQLIAAAPALRASKVPARILWGLADEVFDAEPSLSWLASNLGGLREITRLNDGKLFFPEEQPGVVSDVLEAFWRETG